MYWIFLRKFEWNSRKQSCNILMVHEDSWFVTEQNKRTTEKLKQFRERQFIHYQKGTVASLMGHKNPFSSQKDVTVAIACNRKMYL